MTSVPLLASRSEAVVPAFTAALTGVIVSVLGDVLVASMPMALGDFGWRFRFSGVLLTTGGEFAVVLTVMAAIGLLTGARRVLRGAAIAAIVFGIIYLVLLPFFGLDMLQSRRLVSESAKYRFTLAAFKTAFMGGIFGLLFLWLGIKGLAASKRIGQAERADSGGLFVGQ